MCRNIRPLFNFDPPASEEEVRAAALQYVRKISGYNKPSQVNTAAFEAAVNEITKASSRLLAALQSGSGPKDRETEAARARQRSARRHRPEGKA